VPSALAAATAVPTALAVFPAAAVPAVVAPVAAVTVAAIGGHSGPPEKSAGGGRADGDLRRRGGHALRRVRVVGGRA